MALRGESAALERTLRGGLSREGLGLRLRREDGVYLRFYP